MQIHTYVYTVGLLMQTHAHQLLALSFWAALLFFDWIRLDQQVRGIFSPSQQEIVPLPLSFLFDERKGVIKMRSEYATVSYAW